MFPARYIGLGNCVRTPAGLVRPVRRIYDVPRVLLLARDKLRRLTAINVDIMIRTVALLFSFAYFTSLGARGGDVMLAANAILITCS